MIDTSGGASVANKDFQQFFSSDFAGIDGQRSALEPEANFVNRALNYEMSVGNNLRGRIGCQTIGNCGFFAVFPYRFNRTQNQYDILYRAPAGTYPNQTPNLDTTAITADGATVERLVGLNQQAWVLDTMSIVVSYVSGTYPFSWYSYADSSSINFVIKENGSIILNEGLGDGITSSVTIWELLGDIDALAQLSVSRTTRGTCHPYAIVDGNQTTASIGSATYGQIYEITVSAHNFAAGDIICFPLNSLLSFSPPERLSAGVVIATTATTIRYVGQQVSLVGSSILGNLGQDATSYPIDVAQSVSGGNLTISFPYWRLIPEGDATVGSLYGRPFFHASASAYTKYDSWLPPVAENMNSILYIACSSPSDYTVNRLPNNLAKIDDKQLSRVGLPAPIISATNTGAGALTGLYKYKAYFKRYDAQGNIIEGRVSSVSSITYAAEYGTVTFTNNIAFVDATGYMVRGCYKRTTESPTAGQFFYVDDNAGTPLSPNIQPGDVICLTDNTAQKTGLAYTFGGTVLGRLHRTVCTAFSAQATTISPTASSIRVGDSSGYTINDNTIISTGLTLVVLRTTAGGNTFYELCELPVNGYTTSLTFTDNVTDANLIISPTFTEPEIGKEHDPPPPCTLVCQHQGGLVVTRGPNAPNTVTVSTAEGIEYFPTASNSFDVPSNQSGSITAIASDSDDRLAVFKDRAYYDVVGDVDAGNFSISIKNEGDYGVSSQSSLIRVPFGLIGLSRNGFVIIKDGQLNPWAFREANARLINQEYYYNWATAFNDHVNRQYICTIPQVTGNPVGFAIDYSRRDETDAERFFTKIFERSYPTNVDQGGGGALVSNVLYHLSSAGALAASTPLTVFRRLRRFDGNSPHLGDGDAFVDNTVAINYVLESPPINRGEPGLLKSAIRLRIWSIPNDYVVEGWVPFSFLVESGASPLVQYIGSSNPLGTSATVTFSSESNLFQDVKLVKNRAHFYIVRFTTNTIRTSPFITGYELMFADNYDKEDFQK
ncbi:MAG: hypothetical protein BWY21_00352 [Parcubacteria group bacterium ADurb.Bin216]|nr:MAG: hypothetical protein BWY21_00352 [Parcubacteria group bacterium ADurb.Bin216]